MGTVEIRAFNGCNYAGKVKTTVVFVLMIAAKAKTAKCASTKKPREYNEQSAAYDMRVFLLLYFSEHNRRNTTESNW